MRGHCALASLPPGAGRLGFFGFEKLGVSERVLIFSALGALIWAAAQEFVNQMIPGSRHRLTPRTLLQVTIVVMIAVFALLFHDDQTTNFVSAGIACLSAGLLHAIPTALVSWLVLRRGFAANATAAAFAAGWSEAWPA